MKVTSFSLVEACFLLVVWDQANWILCCTERCKWQLQTLLFKALVSFWYKCIASCLITNCSFMTILLWQSCLEKLALNPYIEVIFWKINFLYMKKRNITWLLGIWIKITEFWICQKIVRLNLNIPIKRSKCFPKLLQKFHSDSVSVSRIKLTRGHL